MECKRCKENKQDSEFIGKMKVCKSCHTEKRQEPKQLADNQIFAYGVVLTFNTRWKPMNLPDEKVLAVVADMRAGAGLLEMVSDHKIPREVVVDICGGKAYADVTGIKLSEAKVWWQAPAKKPRKEAVS